MNLQEIDRSNIWHPFTQEALAKENIHIVKAKGSILFDKDGKVYDGIFKND